MNYSSVGQTARSVLAVFALAGAAAWSTGVRAQEEWVGAPIVEETVVVGPDGRIEWLDDDCGCPTCGPVIEPGPTPVWDGYVDGLLLVRDRLGNDIDFATLSGGVILGTQDFHQKFEGGLRGRVARRLGDEAQLEGVYFGLQEWNHLATVRDITPNALGGAGNMMSPFSNFGHPPTAGLDFNTLAAISLKSTLSNVEVNLTHICPVVYGPCHSPLEFSGLFGVRYMRVHETFGYYTQSDVPAALGSINDVTTAAENKLYAFQIGGVVNWWIKEDWWFNFELKAAVAQNRASQGTVYSNTDNVGVTTSYAYAREQDQTAFIGDLILASKYQPTESVVVRFGYQATFVDGLAVAAENFSPNIGVLTLGPAEIRQNATVVYHGPFIGLELMW